MLVLFSQIRQYVFECITLLLPCWQFYNQGKVTLMHINDHQKAHQLFHRKSKCFLYPIDTIPFLKRFSNALKKNFNKSLNVFYWWWFAKHMNPGIDPDHRHLDILGDPWRTTLTYVANWSLWL